MTNTLLARPLFLAVALSWAGLAHAGTVQSTMSISTTVQSSCLVSAAPMAFGTYDPVSTSPTNATSTVTVTCTAGTSFVVGLNAGGAPGATVTARQMSSAANRLDYGLFSDAARTNNWGNTPGVDALAPITATTSPSVIPVYGRMPAQQNVPAGAYSDTVTVTVTY